MISEVHAQERPAWSKIIPQAQQQSLKKIWYASFTIVTLPSKKQSLIIYQRYLP